MREDDRVALALELFQLFRKINASPPNAFGAEIYPSTYHQLIWRFWAELQMWLVKAFVPNTTATNTAAATTLAPRASPPPVLRDRTKWKKRAPLDAVTSAIHWHHAHQLRWLRELKTFSGHKPH